MYEEFRNRRGYVERRLVGYGPTGGSGLSPWQTEPSPSARRPAASRDDPIEKVQEAERRRNDDERER
jgi:hypothetical protein